MFDHDKWKICFKIIICLIMINGKYVLKLLCLIIINIHVDIIFTVLRHARLLVFPVIRNFPFEPLGNSFQIYHYYNMEPLYSILLTTPYL